MDESTTEKPRPVGCYMGMKPTNPVDSIQDAITQICVAIEKYGDAPMSAESHLDMAIARLVSCLPGWQPDKLQKPEVDNSLKWMRFVAPDRFVDSAIDSEKK